ncbi:major facilitator superfamily domain-containing protein [Aspergillus ambiguus]|uniref:major facilitator superfamily domain-containing protein n=1 Tax=Aspergillus ambiguus TaxID=176160 RepID=UPI003CCD6BBB
MVAVAQKLKFLAIAGTGFFTDGYINLTIGLDSSHSTAHGNRMLTFAVVPMLGYLYFETNDLSVPSAQSYIMKGGLGLGMIVGQILFGVLGDACGRHAVYGKELIITLCGTLLVILLPWNGMSAQGITAWIAVFRVLTGVDYPMSSALSVEKAALGSRAIQVLLVFACIGVGNYAASIVFIVLLRASKSAIYRDLRALEWVWRLLLGIGMIPASVTLYARLTLAETTPYKQYVSDEDGKRGIRHQLHDFRVYFSEWRQAKVLFATCATWFLFDIAYYGINLNQSVILKQIGYASGEGPWTTLWNTAVGNIIVQAPFSDFFVGIPLPDRVGRVRQQLYSSATVCVLYAIWAGVSTPLAGTSTGGLMALFTLCQLVICVGPNCTTFLIPSEVFPTRVRGTAHGVSAAAGKVGAVITAFAFNTVRDRIGLSGVLELFSGIMGLTALITAIIPETNGRTVEEIEKDEQYGGKVGVGR